MTIYVLLQATMIYAGFYTELLSCNPLNPIKLTMVRHCRYIQTCTPCSIVCLYPAVLCICR